MAKKIKPPAIRVIAVTRECGKVFCRECDAFIGLMHKDGDSPVIEECCAGHKTCTTLETLGEFTDSVRNEIATDEVARLMQEELNDDPFDFGDD